MNLVQVATWIQEGYREYYDNYDILKYDQSMNISKHVMRYVMIKCGGHLNPEIISHLVKLETSVPDQNGTVLL